MRQLSVSLPHKEAALAFADRCSDAARAIGAANTLTWSGPRPALPRDADNTDWIGFTRAIEPLGPWRGRRASVVGAGGAARGIVYALQHLDCEVLLVAPQRRRARAGSRASSARGSARSTIPTTCW